MGRHNSRRNSYDSGKDSSKTKRRSSSPSRTDETERKDTRFERLAHGGKSESAIARIWFVYPSS